MTTVIKETDIKVTSNKSYPQVWIGASKLLLKSGFEQGKRYLKKVTDNSVTLQLCETEGTHVVTSKKEKPMLDIKGLPEKIASAERVKIIFFKDKIIITLHHMDTAIEERETTLINCLADGKRVKVGSLFAGSKLKEMLQDAGLVQLANDISCRAAIEINHEDVAGFKSSNPHMFCDDIITMNNVCNALEVDKSFYNDLNGLLINASAFEIKKSAKGKHRYASNDDGYDQKGSLFYLTIDAIKKANPAFALIQAEYQCLTSKKDMKEREDAFNILFTVYSAVLNSLGYDIEQEITQAGYTKTVTLLAISKGISKDTLEASCAAIEHHTNTQSSIVVWDKVSIDEIAAKREARTLHKVKTGLTLEMGSTFSGGGILDQSIHEGLNDLGVSSYCKFGMEWMEAYAMSNLENNQVWRSNSFFLIGDARNVNVHINALPLIDGIALGVPCIGASKSGLVKNKISCAEAHEVAGALFVTALDIMLYSQPAFIVLENVPEYQSTVSMEVVRSALISSGYNITENVLSGNDYGALEDRKRLVMIAVSKNIGDPSELLNNVPAVIAKQSTLNDILEEVPITSTTWSWRDYLDAKAVNDKAKGNNFDQQLLTGLEPKCGTIGKSYMKARSTEPFKRFPLSERFSDILSELKETGDLLKAVLSGVTTKNECIMYSNFAKNMMAKFNRRNALKDSLAKTSQLSDLMLKHATSTFEPMDLANEILSNADLSEEFTISTEAISKATRLFTTTEHCAVKRVDPKMIQGLSDTTAHEVLGNSVIKTKFQAVARKVAAFLINTSEKAVVRLVKNDSIQQMGISSNVTTLVKNEWNYHFIRNTDTSYIIINPTTAIAV